MIRTLVAGILLFVAPHAAADDRIKGPILADVLRVVDGDTIEVRAHVWPGQSVEVKVRLAGIDAPELSRAGCDAERDTAVSARDALEATLQGALVLRDIRHGKYGGRVLASAATPDGRDLGDILLSQGLAVRYGDDASWCAGA